MRPSEGRFTTTLHAICRPKVVVPALALATALVVPSLAAPAFAQNLSIRGGGLGNFKAVTPSSNFRVNTGNLTGRTSIDRLSNGVSKGSRVVTGGKGGKNKGTKIVDPRRPNPGGDGTRPPRNPKWPKPTWPGVIVTLPPGGVLPPSGNLPPNNFSGSGQSGSPAFRRLGGVPPANETRYEPNVVLVEVLSSAPQQAVDAFLRRHRLTQLQSFNLQVTNTTLYRLRITDRRSVPAVVRAVEADGFARAVQPNYYAMLSEMPVGAANVSDLEQYALAKLQLPQAHGLSRGDKILVAVIDSGVDARHPALTGMIADSFDAIGSGEKVHPHGTAVAGAIVAQARLTGVAPSAQILAVRSFSEQRGKSSDIIPGLDWAIVRGARVINMSFAGARDPGVQERVTIAHQRGIVVVAAAGNEGPKADPAYPAALPQVIAVTATDENDKLFHAANRGRHIAVAAPGVDVWVLAPNGQYAMRSGTSFAAPEVSGVVALLLERKPDLDPESVRRVLMATARDLGPKGVDPMFGAGLVDAYRALLAVAPPAVETAGTQSPAPAAITPAETPAPTPAGIESAPDTRAPAAETAGSAAEQ